MNSSLKASIEKILLKVQNPARYIGNELNICIKDKADLRVAISYPDLYEIGMSNAGIDILYQRGNSLSDVACERVFAVEPDFEKLLRMNKIPLYTLETFTPLNQLDLIGFNLSHELLYTNVLQILDLGGVPLLRTRRGDGDPLIIGGGEMTSNPFPLFDIFDFFVIGEGEDVFREILQLLLEMKLKGLSRKEQLSRFSDIDGILVPENYSMDYNGVECIAVTGPSVSKRLYRSCDAVQPYRPLVPSVRIAQERAVLEVSRGCYNMCRFCHAGFYTLPYRPCDPVTLTSKAFKILESTGYNELTLSSLSASDYPALPELLNRIMPRLTEKGVALSLPSLRIDTETLPVLEHISDVKRTSLTFAIESASDEIRQSAHKKVKREDLFIITDFAFQRGWRHMKFYFMLGLPGSEEYDEIAATVDLLKELLARAGKGKDINITLSPFVPKPHTPFERMPQRSAEYFYDAILKIKQQLPRNIKVRNHLVDSSVLEAVFARGNALLGPALIRAYQQGCRLDSWKEHFKPDIWFAVLDEVLPGWTDFLGPMHGKFLPWSVIQTGYERLKEIRSVYKMDLNSLPAKRKYSVKLDRESMKSAFEQFKRRYEVVQRMRLRFEKTGPARFLSHLDLMEVIKRAVRMAEIPVSMTQGFNKRERISMGLPLPVGIASIAEICDIDLFEKSGTDIISKLNPNLPAGIRVVSAEEIDETSSVMSVVCGAIYEADMGNMEDALKIFDSLEKKISFIKKTKKGEREIPFASAVRNYEMTGGIIKLELPLNTPESVRIDNLIAACLGSDPRDLGDMHILKTGQFRFDKSGAWVLL